MKLLALLEATKYPLNEGIMDAMIETAVPTATEMLHESLVLGDDSGGRDVAIEIFRASVYGDPYAEPSDYYEVVEAKFHEWLDEWCTARVENAAQSILNGISHYRHPHMNGLVVYRVIVGDENLPSTITSRGLGEYWSWDEYAAEAHWAGEGDIEYLLVGLVEPSDVNWEQTLFQNAHPSYEHEKEIFIPHGTPIELYKLLDGHRNEVDPSLYGGRQMLSASKGLTEAIKIGGVSPNVEAFMDEFESMTKPNPLTKSGRMYGDVRLGVYPSRGGVRLGDIQAAVGRGTGAGTEALKFLTGLADKHGVRITGDAMAYGQAHQQVQNTDRLFRWYLKHGFDGGTDVDGNYTIEYEPRMGESKVATGARIARSLGLREAVRIGEPQSGLLYRWVEPRKSLSNMKTNSLYPGKWKHNIPNVGAVSGISLGYDAQRWNSYDAVVGFVLNRDKLNAKKIIDIPGQEIYNYSNATLNPLGDAHYASEYEKHIEDAEVDEAFYVGIIRPLSGALEKIIVTPNASPKIKEAVQVYADEYGIRVEWGQVGESKVATGARVARLSELRNEDDAARMARAQAMGFDTSRVWYHGTNRSFDAFSKDVDPVFDNAQQYLGYFFTGDPNYAAAYTKGNDPELTEYGGGNIVPVFLRAKKLKAEDLDFIDELEGNEMGGWTFEEVEEYKNDLIRQGYDGINFGNGYEIAIFDERNIRSIHAKFNDSYSANLMASIGESAGGQYVYHAATARDFSSIMQKGLTFFNPSRWTKAASPNERYQDEPSVFAFEHPHDAWRWAAKMEWEFKEPAVVVKFKRGDSWGKDPSEDIAIQMGKGKALQSHEPIPASDIVGAKTVAQIGTPASTGLHGAEFDQHVIDTLEGR